MAKAKSKNNTKGLVLARKTGQSITIDGSMTITVVEVKGGIVRLHFDGHQQVFRTEVYEEKFSGPSSL